MKKRITSFDQILSKLNVKKNLYVQSGKKII
jgi:hypothetical protein